ncbi:MAG: cytochrome c3 family protein [Halioglobus sp.]|nr:cytochrome c3 family protein [Halioglobus sp.]
MSPVTRGRVRSGRALLLLAAAFLPGATAPADPLQEPIVYGNNPMGRASFDHKAHVRAHRRCETCHDRLFEERVGATRVTFDRHHSGEACFACHEISYSDTGNCMECHEPGAPSGQD